MSTAPPVRLSLETEFYDANKFEWLQNHRDEFVVVKGADLLGFFINFHDAYQSAVDKYGVSADFLVKRVTAQEPIFVVY